jgi:hypothetical protein
MPSMAVAKVDIADVSEGFRANRTVDVGDLRDLVIPIRGNNISCEAYFESPITTKGTRLLVTVNGDDVLELVYDDESGSKQDAVDVTHLLNPGQNDLRVRCLTSCHPLDGTVDSGLVWLRSRDSTVIRKKYETRGSLEPFDQRWALWYEPEVDR